MTVETGGSGRVAVRRRVAVAVGAATILGAALRLYGLGRESFWLDEMISLQIARGGLAMVASEAAVGREPLYYSLLIAWRAWLGESEAAIRSLSAVAGIAAIPLQYLMVRQIAGARVGAASAFLLAILPTQIYYAQEARAYSWMIAFALASQVACSRLSRSSTLRDWALYLLPTVAMLYTHATGVFLLAAQNAIWWLCRRERIRPRAWLFCQALLAVAVLPIIGEDATSIAAGSHPVQGWIGEASLRDLLRCLHWLLVPSYSIVRPSVLVPFLGLLVLLRVAAAFWPARPRMRQLGAVRRNALTTFVLLAVVPILGPFVLAQLFGNLFITRYTLVATPGLCGLAALLLVSARSRLAGTASLAVIAFAVGLVLPRAAVVRLKEPWRQAVAFAEAEAAPGDVLLTRESRFGTTAALIEYYRRTAMPVCEVSYQSRLRCRAAELSGARPARLWSFFRAGFSSAEKERASLERATGQPVRRLRSRAFRSLGLVLFEVKAAPPEIDPGAVAAPLVDR